MATSTKVEMAPVPNGTVPREKVGDSQVPLKSPQQGSAQLWKDLQPLMSTSQMIRLKKFWRASTALLTVLGVLVTSVVYIVAAAKGHHQLLVRPPPLSPTDNCTTNCTVLQSLNQTSTTNVTILPPPGYPPLENSTQSQNSTKTATSLPGCPPNPPRALP